MDTWIEGREVINSSRNVIHATVINSIIVKLQNIDTSNREVDARRQELEGRLADFGVPVDSYPDDYQRYVHHHIGNIDDVVATILQQHESVRAKEDRRRPVVAKLKAIKLKLRQDSRLCQAYIDDGTGNVDEIVVDCVWNITSVRDDPDDNDRPPRSFWQTIDDMCLAKLKQLAVRKLKVSYPKESNGVRYISYDIQEMDVVRELNKLETVCIGNWQNYDESHNIDAEYAVSMLAPVPALLLARTYSPP